MLIKLEVLKTTGEIFLKNLRHRRETGGFTQTSFAVEVGLSLRGYQKYEQGETQPTPEVFDRFAKALGCRPWDLITPSDQADVIRKKDQRQSNDPQNSPESFFGHESAKLSLISSILAMDEGEARGLLLSLDSDPAELPLEESEPTKPTRRR